MILSTAIMAGFENEITGKIYRFWGNIHINHYNSSSVFEAEKIKRNASYIANIKKINGIAHMQAYASVGGIIKTNNELEGIILKGIGTDFDWQNFSSFIKQGTIINTRDTLASNEIVISLKTARRLGLKLNDAVIIYFTPKKNSSIPSIRKFTIVGLYNSGIDEFDKIYALIDIRKVQQLLGWNEDEIGGFEIRLSDISWNEKRKMYSDFLFDNEQLSEEKNMFVRIWKSLNLLIQKDERQIAMQYFSTSLFYNYIDSEHYSRTIIDVFPSIFDWIDVNNINKWVIMILMLIVSVINMITALLVLIIERTRMIGLLKALGSNDWLIRKIFLYNAAYIIGYGLLWGNILGLGLCWLQKSFGIIRLDESSYYLSTVPISVSVSSVVFINIMSLCIILMCLILPTKYISKIAPVKALRLD